MNTHKKVSWRYNLMLYFNLNATKMSNYEDIKSNNRWGKNKGLIKQNKINKYILINKYKNSDFKIKIIKKIVHHILIPF